MYPSLNDGFGNFFCSFCELSLTNSLVPCYCYIQVECNNSMGAVMCTKGCNAPSALNLKIKSFVKGVCMTHEVRVK